MQESLDTFLATYRTTPNPSAPEGKSPSEIMFGRRIRTSLDLLRPFITRKPTNEENQPIKRSFDKNDKVYVKVYTKNTWSWLSGIVFEKIGKVMCNVWIEGRRMIRSHFNQMRHRRSSEAISAGSIQNKLPLDILLESCNVSSPDCSAVQPSVVPAPSPVASEASTLNAPPSHQSTPLQQVHQPGKVWRSPMSDSRESSSSSQSPSSTSPEFLSADSDPAVPLPRRSSRVRRQPQRFDAYQLH
ncbi:uncharacterized protein K02A2.6-like [Wyeomyia smithii]|uniref:uncharacterized protein K02A2.6-like n=1 Tax=Wyeomyia smithii TaxID=174621 RepID=UPI002467BF6E|nr:uncharacterized protein K02A2.6-like [Wyeomyia smithii]